MSIKDRRKTIDKLVKAAQKDPTKEEVTELFLNYRRLIMFLTSHYGIDENKDIIHQVGNLIENLKEDNKQLKKQVKALGG